MPWLRQGVGGRVQVLQRREIWWPTRLGWALLVVGSLLPAAGWVSRGESFLALNRPVEQASILVVEGWIGLEGMQAARDEYQGGNYVRVLATGGMSTNRWELVPQSYAERAEKELQRLGVMEDQVLLARPDGTEVGRTYQAARAVKKALAEQGLTPDAVNVFTVGMHARRSRLVYQKVLGSGIRVGSIAWMPRKELDRPWWQSSDRSKSLINETVGYAFEKLANSGRGLLSGDPPGPGAPERVNASRWK